MSFSTDDNHIHKLTYKTQCFVWYKQKESFIRKNKIKFNTLFAEATVCVYIDLATCNRMDLNMIYSHNQRWLSNMIANPIGYATVVWMSRIVVPVVL